MLERALTDARGAGRRAADAVTVMPVPGAFELPLAAMALAKTRRFACVVALGCVIRGRDAALRLHRGRGGERPAARRARDRRAGRVRRAHVRDGRAGRGADRAGGRGRARRARDGRPLRPDAGPEPLGPSATLPRPWPRSAPFAGRSRPSGTAGATRWWPRSAASTPTCSASASCSTASADPRVRLHALPQGRQGSKSRLKRRTSPTSPSSGPRTSTADERSATSRSRIRVSDHDVALALSRAALELAGAQPAPDRRPERLSGARRRHRHEPHAHRPRRSWRRSSGTATDEPTAPPSPASSPTPRCSAAAATPASSCR